MSSAFITHLIMDNKIDTGFIDKTFNLPLDPLWIVTPINDTHITPCLHYHGMISLLGEEESYKFCYKIENGASMFFRRKYEYYNTRNHMFLSRGGESFYNHGPGGLGRFMTKDELDELDAVSPPPIEELKSLFDHILEFNTQFYLFFSVLDVEAKIEDHKWYLESILNNRIIREHKSDVIQQRLIALFADISVWAVDMYDVDYGSHTTDSAKNNLRNILAPCGDDHVKGIHKVVLKIK